jgi:hypothetical protein
MTKATHHVLFEWETFDRRGRLEGIVALPPDANLLEEAKQLLSEYDVSIEHCTKVVVRPLEAARLAPPKRPWWRFGR